jgi:hypothetical protein
LNEHAFDFELLFKWIIESSDQTKFLCSEELHQLIIWVRHNPR